MNVVNSPPIVSNEFLWLIALLFIIIIFLFWFFNYWTENKIQSKTAENIKTQELVNTSLKDELDLFKKERLLDRASHEQAIKELKDNSKAEMKEMKENYKSEIQSLKQSTEKLQSTIETLNNRITDEKIRHNEQKMKLSQEITDLKMAHNEEKTKLMGEIFSLKASIHNLECDLKMEQEKCEKLSQELSEQSNRRSGHLEHLLMQVEPRNVRIARRDKVVDMTDNESFTPPNSEI